jgi:hypothetical protein
MAGSVAGASGDGGAAGSGRGGSGAATLARFSEKSLPSSDAPQTQRARSGAFSRSQTGQTRTYSLATA